MEAGPIIGESERAGAEHGQRRRGLVPRRGARAEAAGPVRVHLLEAQPRPSRRVQPFDLSASTGKPPRGDLPLLGDARRPVRRWLRRRLGPLLALSAALHLLLLLAFLLLREGPGTPAVEPPSFDVLFQHGAPIERGRTEQPSQLPEAVTSPAPGGPPPSAALPPTAPTPSTQPSDASPAVPPQGAVPPSAVPPNIVPPSASLPTASPPAAAPPQAATPGPATPALPGPPSPPSAELLPAPEPLPAPAAPSQAVQTSPPQGQPAPSASAPAAPTSAAPPSSQALAPAVPVPAAPAPPEPPQVRLSLGPVELPPLPEAEPAPLLPGPAPNQAGPRHAAPFPKPMDTSLGQGLGRRAPRIARGTGAIDLVPGRAILDAPGASPRQSNAGQGSIRIRGAHLGPDWEDQLHEWWLEHRYYPQEAAQAGQDGLVTVHLKLDRFGRVQEVQLVSSSGSQWLDLGALAVFRNQKLPPFPPGAKEGTAEIDIDIDYILLR